MRYWVRCRRCRRAQAPLLRVDSTDPDARRGWLRLCYRCGFWWWLSRG